MNESTLHSQSSALVLSSIGLGALGSDWTGVELDPHLIAAGRAFFLPATDRVAVLIKAFLKVAIVQCVTISNGACIG
jgi:hypothetical protein